MLKAAGSILVLLTTTSFGFLKAAEHKKAYTELLYVQRIFYMIQSEMRYSRNPLGDIFFHVGGRVRDPYREWMTQLGRKLAGRDCGTFAGIWEKSVWTSLGNCGLPEEELRRIEALGGQIGAVDLEMQMKSFELYLMEASASLDEMREGMKTKVRLCRCLGIMSGMLIVTLLV